MFKSHRNKSPKFLTGRTLKYFKIGKCSYIFKVERLWIIYLNRHFNKLLISGKR